MSEIAVEDLLTADDVAAYTSDGFLVLDRFCTDDELATLRAAYDEVLAEPGSAPGDRMLGGITRQVMTPSEAHPAFDRNTVVARAIRVARRLFGAEKVFRTFDMLMDKPPGHPHETPWHQDMSYAAMPVAEEGLAIPLGTIQFWIALDDADAENGCMHFLRGHHTQPLKPHHVASGDPEDEGRLLAITDPSSHLDLDAAVCAAIPAGGVTLHSYGTPHYTPPNRSATRSRRAYIFNLAAARP